ncbi:hypothetical protein BC826DRAFT_627443 [Russula brevipes]|nr:hypothetical protein BC826DRAFT_627443 [Russula brevipes]
MHSPSSNTSGPDAGHWQPPSDPHLQALVSSTDVQPTLPPHEGPAFPVPQTMPAAVQPMTADIVDTRGSPVPFPAPQRTWTMSSGPTPPPSFPPLRNIQSVPELSTCTHSPPTQHSDAVAKGSALRETLVYPEGEIPVAPRQG